jgi:hypothetical protein
MLSFGLLSDKRQNNMLFFHNSYRNMIFLPYPLLLFSLLSDKYCSSVGFDQRYGHP